jgi:hypothetical protein
MIQLLNQSSWECGIDVAYDDTTIEKEPSQNIDYLSYDWKFEDTWLTRRYIQRREGVYRKRVRLENALWRSWAKIYRRLRTIPARSLNW